MQNKPNFLIVGAPKCGTTSIAQYLKEHPEIFIPEEKEPFYFLPNILKDTNPEDPMYDAIRKRAHLTKESYYGLFATVKGEKKIGEATVHYLYHYNEVIPKIKEELGDIPIIIVLRNPALRAFSNYKYQSLGEYNSFEKALRLEEKRAKNKYNSFWLYKDVGNYYEPVKAYLDSFSNVYVSFFEDLKQDPIVFMRDMYNFLNVKESFIPNTNRQHNPTMVPKNELFHFLYYLRHKYHFKIWAPQFIKNLLRNKFVENKEKICEKTLSGLKQYYKPNIIKLEALIGRDLSSWYM